MRLRKDVGLGWIVLKKSGEPDAQAALASGGEDRSLPSGKTLSAAGNSDRRSKELLRSDRPNSVQVLRRTFSTQSVRS